MATKMFRLEGADFFRGLAVAVFSAIITFLQQLLSSTADLAQIKWNLVLGVGVASALGYITKNLGTNEKDEVLGIAATAPENSPPAKE